MLLANLSSISQIAAYEAPWHILSTQLLIFLLSIVFGHYLYFRLISFLSSARNFEIHIWVGKMTALLAILGLLTAATVTVASSIVDRRADWEGGDAPLLGAADRNEEWVNSAWEILESHRANRARN